MTKIRMKPLFRFHPGLSKLFAWFFLASSIFGLFLATLALVTTDSVDRFWEAPTLAEKKEIDHSLWETIRHRPDAVLLIWVPFPIAILCGLVSGVVTRRLLQANRRDVVELMTQTTPAPFDFNELLVWVKVGWPCLSLMLLFAMVGFSFTDNFDPVMIVWCITILMTNSNQRSAYLRAWASMRQRNPADTAGQV